MNTSEANPKFVVGFRPYKRGLDQGFFNTKVGIYGLTITPGVASSPAYTMNLSPATPFPSSFSHFSPSPNAYKGPLDRTQRDGDDDDYQNENLKNQNKDANDFITVGDAEDLSDEEDEVETESSRIVPLSSMSKPKSAIFTPTPFQQLSSASPVVLKKTLSQH